jgi:hypothetical protein
LKWTGVKSAGHSSTYNGFITTAYIYVPHVVVEEIMARIFEEKDSVLIPD